METIPSRYKIFSIHFWWTAIQASPENLKYSIFSCNKSRICAVFHMISCKQHTSPCLLINALITLQRFPSSVSIFQVEFWNFQIIITNRLYNLTWRTGLGPFSEKVIRNEDPGLRKWAWFYSQIPFLSLTFSTSKGNWAFCTRQHQAKKI